MGLRLVCVCMLLCALVLCEGARDPTKPKLKRKLMKAERQRLIDLQNMLRAKIAKGEETGQPSASNMLALEWDDRLEKQAQRWADQCSTEMHDTLEARKFGPYPSIGQNYFGNKPIDYGVVVSWYGEHKDYNYYGNTCSGICGHYTQLTWAQTHLMGCGYNNCRGRFKFTKLYCNYARGGNAPWTGETGQPYKEGKPCTDCPSGYSFCMEGALCASKKACDSGESKCECLLSAGDCQNGAQFDSDNCMCKCPEGFEGPKCDVPCADKRDSCEWMKSVGYCEYSNSNTVLTTLPECRKTCGFCGSIIANDPDTVNANGIATNVKKVEILSDLGGKTRYQKPTLPPRGSCFNKLPDEKCDEWARYGNCEANPVAMKVDCPASCNMCEHRRLGNCKNTADEDKCKRLADAGYCENDKDWMSKNCQRECNTC